MTTSLSVLVSFKPITASQLRTTARARVCTLYNALGKTYEWLLAYESESNTHHGESQSTIQYHPWFYSSDTRSLRSTGPFTLLCKVHSIGYAIFTLNYT